MSLFYSPLRQGPSKLSRLWLIRHADISHKAMEMGWEDRGDHPSGLPHQPSPVLPMVRSIFLAHAPRVFEVPQEAEREARLRHEDARLKKTGGRTDLCASSPALRGCAGCARVPENLRSKGVPAAQAQTPSRPVRAGKKQRLLKKLHRLARCLGVVRWSLDECHFQQHDTRCRMWVSPEIKDSVLSHVPTHKWVACFGAVSLSTGKFVRSMCAKFDAATFETFLKTLLRHRSHGKRMVIVLDDAKYHCAVLLKPLLRKYRIVLTSLFLPPYSLQLAPIERVWKLARRMATHNRCFVTLGELLTPV